MTSMRLTLVLAVAAMACGDDAAPVDGGLSGDGGSAADAATSDGGPQADMRPPDGGSPADAFAGTDSGPGDAGPVDGGPVDGGPPPLPASCAAEAECGANAGCDLDLGVCVCDSGHHACGASCCPWEVGRDIELAPSGADPEIGSDAAGNVYVLFLRASHEVVLATLAPGALTPTFDVVATATGELDSADLAVAPDGTVWVAVHEPGGGSRAAAFELYTRAAGASDFTPMSLLGAGLEGFAFAAGVSLGRAPNGNLHAIAVAKSGDGQSGLIYTSYDASLGAWASRRILSFGHRRTELFARDDGFFLRTAWTDRDRFHFVAFDGTVGWTESRTHGSFRFSRSSAGLADDGTLWWLFDNDLGTDGAATTETLPTTALPRSGQRGAMDMVVDREGNPVVAFHRLTSTGVAAHVGLTSRMPDGGWTPSDSIWPESFLVPFPEVSGRFTLDLERVPGGYLAIAGGDSQWGGPLRYVELR
jgi:hypothetical protein